MGGLWRPGGGLWAFTEREVLHLKDGAVSSHYKLNGFRGPHNVSEAADGSLWVLRAGYGLDAPLCHITARALKCFGKSDGVTVDTGGYALLPDGKGGFWLGGQRVIAHWREGAVTETYPIEALKANADDGVGALASGPDGSLWVGLLASGPGRGLGKLVNGVFRPFVTPAFDGSQVKVQVLTLDRDGSLWVGTQGNGVLRIRGDRVEHYGRAEGLSGDNVWDVFEDREGILWITTTNGVDNFVDPHVSTFSRLEGLGQDAAIGVLAGKNGTIWAANLDSLDRISKNGSISSIRPGKGFPGGQVSAMLEDRAGNLWVGVYDGLYLLNNGKFRRLSEPDHQPLGLIVALTEDIDGQCLGRVCRQIPQVAAHSGLSGAGTILNRTASAGTTCAGPAWGILDWHREKKSGAVSERRSATLSCRF